MAGNGWNRASPSTQVKPAKKPTVARGAIAGIVVVALGVIAAWFVLKPTEDTGRERRSEKHESRIKEARPSIPKKDANQQKAAVHAESSAEDANGGAVKEENATPKVVKDPKHDLIYAEENPCELYAKRPKYHIFKYNAENDIATLLCVTPGSTIIGEPDYSKGFMVSFEACADIPMDFPSDDTEENKQLRLAVAEAKRELLERQKAGEDIAKIMSDTRKELRQLWQYKLQLEGEVLKARDNEELSDEDVDDFIDAANKMLDEKGVARIDPNHFTRDILKYQMNRGIKQEAQSDEVQ